MESGKREAPELALASLSEGRDRPGPSGRLSQSLGKEVYMRFLKDAFQKENGLYEDEKQWPRTAFKVGHTGKEREEETGQRTVPWPPARVKGDPPAL